MVMRMHAVKDAFDEFDIDKTGDSKGVLDKDEFRKALQKLKVDLTEDDLKTLRVDADKDGNIDEAEFRRFAEYFKGDAISEACVPWHLSQQVAESNRDICFSTEGLSSVVLTQSGTMPGDPFGDELFKFF